ncbi:MAG TPA: gliding motility-associated C-terminal domain-containing protein, partial [Flavobacteriales bacterium]
VEFTPVLGISTPDSTHWAGTSTLVNNANAPLVSTATPDEAGIAIYAFSVTDNFGCTYDTTITVLVNPSPGANPVITGDTIACANAGVVLEVQGIYQEYLWNNGFNGSIVLVGPGTYTVTAGAGDCVMESPPFTVEGIPDPQPVITGVLFNCSGDPAELTTTLPYAQYQWSNGTTNAVAYVSTGTYAVTVTNEAGCSGTSAPVQVLTADAPDASFAATPSEAINMGGTVLYTALSLGPNVATAIWNVDSMTVGSGGSLEHLFPEPGLYAVTLTVTTVEGCEHSYTFWQTVYPDEIIIPNVFSPNGDGKNDLLTFEGAQYYPNTEVKVFNRYGQTLFESGNYKNTWSANGVPDGTYYFVMKLFTGKEYTGHVTLLR